jgi:hypothetical protein
MSRSYTAQIGLNEQAIVAPDAAIYTNLTEYTYAFWIKPLTFITPSNQLTVFSKHPDLGLLLVLYIQDDGSADAQYVDGLNANLESRTVANTIPLNAWTHVAIVLDCAGDAKIHIFVNGVEPAYQIGPQAGNGAVADNSGQGLWIGDNNQNDSFYGYIAEAAVWNAALSQPNIASLAASVNGYLGVAASDPVGYWHLCGAISPEPDASGNGHSGVLSVNPPTRGSNSPGFSACPAAPVAIVRTSVPMSSGPDFATRIESGRTSIMGTNLSTRMVP